MNPAEAGLSADYLTFFTYIILPFFPKLALFYLNARKGFLFNNYNILNYNHIFIFLLVGMVFA